MKFARSRPHIPCGQCGESLFKPGWSEYIDERRVRHLWECKECDYTFQTIVSYEAVAA